MKRTVIAMAILILGISCVVILIDNLDSHTSTSLIVLRCSDSVGQQGPGGERSVGGVEGLVMAGSKDPASLNSLRGRDGRRYYVYKAFLAVSASAAPYATVSILRPRSARLFYGPSSVVGTLASRSQGRGLIAASRSQVRLPVCGPRFTGFVGGIVIVRPTSVTFVVSSPHRQTEKVTVSVGNG